MTLCGTVTNFSKLNLMVLLRFSDLNWKYQILCNFSPKNQNCLDRLKLGTYSNSNRLNSMILSNFSIWTGNILFIRILLKTSPFLFNLKFGTKAISNLLILVKLIISFLDQKYTFWVNLFKVEHLTQTNANVFWKKWF